MSVNDSLPETLEIDGVTVHRLQLGEYALVFEKLQKLPGVASQFLSASQEEIIASIPRLLTVALPDVVAIIAISTGKTEEEANKMSPKTAIKCLKAIFQINDFFGVWEEIQTLLPSNPSPSPKKTPKT